MTNPLRNLTYGSLLVTAGLIGIGSSAMARTPTQVGAPTLPPTTPITMDSQPFFPIGLYSYPKHDAQKDIFQAMAQEGCNFYMLPSTAAKEQLDRAHANDIRIMLRPCALLNLSGTPEQIESKKNKLAELFGPGSVAFDHPAVVALEGPDEPLWATRAKNKAVHLELATWVRSDEDKGRVKALLKGLRDGYEEIHRLCGNRYQIWINFAPRGDEDELRWFTGLPIVGGYEQDGRTTADVFGTDIYPVPGGLGNNGYIRGRIAFSPAAVGMFTERLRRAVHPYPFYMVLQGCGIQEWDKEAVAKGLSKRRPTPEELRFMVFDAIVHGARGIIYWGVHYINDDSRYWQQIAQLNRQILAMAPMLAQGQDWPDARPGMQHVTVLGRIHQGHHYVLATNNDPHNRIPGWIAVPGWQGDKAYSLLDGKSVPVVDDVIRDEMEPMAARVYTDGPLRIRTPNSR